MKMKHAFLILASGKSSRFGGYPKAFCKVDDTYVAQHTVDLGSKFFDNTYLVINREIYDDYKDCCKVVKSGGKVFFYYLELHFNGSAWVLKDEVEINECTPYDYTDWEYKDEINEDIASDGFIYGSNGFVVFNVAYDTLYYTGSAFSIDNDFSWSEYET